MYAESLKCGIWSWQTRRSCRPCLSSLYMHIVHTYIVRTCRFFYCLQGLCGPSHVFLNFQICTGISEECAACRLPLNCSYTVANVRSILGTYLIACCIIALLHMQLSYVSGKCRSPKAHVIPTSYGSRVYACTCERVCQSPINTVRVSYIKNNVQPSF